jgi:hypothetical protein
MKMRLLIGHLEQQVLTKSIRGDILIGMGSVMVMNNARYWQ